MSANINEIPKLVIPRGSKHNYGSVISSHTHARAQLLYASQGSIRVHTLDNVWLVPPQCALWIPAFIEHSVISLSEVHLSTALVEQSAAHIFGDKCFIVRMTNLLKELVLKLNQMDTFQKNNKLYNEDLQKSLHLLIFEEIKYSSTIPVELPWPKDKRLISICEQLINRPDYCKNLDTWLDMIGTSSRTLIRLFRKETGLSYRGWIQQMHIMFALNLLAEGKAIACIATSLGYTNSSAFSAMFKRNLGYSPQKF